MSHFSNFVISALWAHIQECSLFSSNRTEFVYVIDVCIHESVMWPPMCVYRYYFWSWTCSIWVKRLNKQSRMHVACTLKGDPPFQNSILPKWMVNIFSYGHYFLISPRGVLCWLSRGGCILVPSSCYWIFNLCQLKIRIVNTLLSKDHVHDIISFKSRFITTCTLCP